MKDRIEAPYSRRDTRGREVMRSTATVDGDDDGDAEDNALQLRRYRGSIGGLRCFGRTPGRTVATKAGKTLSLRLTLKVVKIQNDRGVIGVIHHPCSGDANRNYQRISDFVFG